MGEIGVIGDNVKRCQQSLQGLYPSIGSTFKLARHAETKSLKEVNHASSKRFK